MDAASDGATEPDDFDDDFDDGAEGDDEDDADQRELSDVLDATMSVEDEGAEALLAQGDVEILGRMPWSSNGTYLVTVSAGDRRAQGIYKPEAAERPLWDFPAGLWRREVASFRLAQALGWDIVPPTVERDGPLGVGSLQFFVPSRFEQHYFTIRDDGRHRRQLEQICLFDLISNNTDRKAGHVLVAHDGRLWGIDHGLSFHEEFKLRTVLWDYAGDPVPADLAADVSAWLDRGGPEDLADLLTVSEVDATRGRAARAVALGRFPHDPTGRRYPWPLV